MTKIETATRTALINAAKAFGKSRISSMIWSAASRQLGVTNRRQMWSISRGKK